LQRVVNPRDNIQLKLETKLPHTGKVEPKIVDIVNNLLLRPFKTGVRNSDFQNPATNQGFRINAFSITRDFFGNEGQHPTRPLTAKKRTEHVVIEEHLPEMFLE
jgi:hypothetical protein